MPTSLTTYEQVTPMHFVLAMHKLTTQPRTTRDIQAGSSAGDAGSVKGEPSLGRWAYLIGLT